ncbi:uncharacterized protein LOC126907995 isoform X2 [Daktulosphaira vitifoliae]|nr:uncharacterized protein LOC126907995 isoform X2 [Daktulosphaira vitifoliae]XP_050545737.1 uncharacterized protein LOC126907995 isoform X2 [Daktulosphaira vitifoliae]
MKISVLLILLMCIKISLSSYAHYLSCSNTRYFLNFFNHNERFLLEFEKNENYLTIENLMNYGKALQTHSKVILIFLDDYMNSTTDKYPFSLITVNMYLNNVSGSLNMIAQNDDDKNDTQKLLEGYKIIHFAIKEQLRNYINEYCANTIFYENMVRCNPFIVKNEYTISNLVITNNGLKFEMLSKFKLTVQRNSYNNFHPKYLLFYDIMTQQILSNKNNTIKIDNSQHIVLNLLRFTPLNIKCFDGTPLTIQDVFEYMKYDFNSEDVLAYINLVISATFRPIAILIRNFITLIQVASSEKSDCVKFWLKPMFIEMGQKIISYIEEFISLNLFNFSQKFLINVLNGFIQILKDYNDNIYTFKSDYKINNLLIKKLSHFFFKNKLYFTSEIVLTNKYITENNADAIKIQLKKYMEKVVSYLVELKIWNNYFNFIFLNFKIQSFNVSKYKIFINFKVLDRICNTESHIEIQNASMNDSNKIDIEYFKDKEDLKDIADINLKDLKDDLSENDTDTNNFLENQSTYKPFYMIDYWPYNV